MRRFVFIACITIFSMCLTHANDYDDDELVTIALQDGERKISVNLALQSKTLRDLIEDVGISAPLPLPNISLSLWEVIQRNLQLIAQDKQEELQSYIAGLSIATVMELLQQSVYLDIPPITDNAIDQVVEKLKNTDDLSKIPQITYTPDIRKLIIQDLLIPPLKNILDNMPITIDQGLRPQAVDWSPDGNLLITASSNTVFFWDGYTFQLRRKLTGQDVVSLAWLPDNKHFISAGYSGITLWNAYSRQLVRKINSVSVFTTALSSDGVLLAVRAGGFDNETKQFKVSPAIGIIDLSKGDIFSHYLDRIEKEEYIRPKFTWIPRTHQLITDTLDVYNGMNGTFITTIGKTKVEDSKVFSVAPNGRYIAFNNYLKDPDPNKSRSVTDIWNLEDNKAIATLISPQNYRYYQFVRVLAWSPDNKRVAVAYSLGENMVEIWDVKQKKIIRVLPLSEWSIDVLKWSPDGKYLLIHDLNRFMLWRMLDENTIGQLQRLSLLQATVLYQYIMGKHLSEQARVVFDQLPEDLKGFSTMSDVRLKDSLLALKNQLWALHNAFWDSKA